MPTLNVAKSLNSTLIQSQPLVAVFFGVTGGIGQCTLRTLAELEAKSGKGLRVYVVARNAKAAEDILDECRRIYPKGQFDFIKAENLSLLKDVDRVCGEITQIEEKEGSDARIDYLMMAQGGPIFKPRTDTPEGLDQTMSLMYYSRMKTILNLMPLLEKSSLPAAVVSVYASGQEAKFFPEDLSLRDLKHYSYSQARSHMVYFHTLFFEALATQHQGKLRLVHVFPGIVPGPGFETLGLPAWFLFLWKWFIQPLFGRWITVSPDECGERMLSFGSARYPALSPADSTGAAFSATAGDECVGSNGQPGSGAYAVGSKGNSNIKAKAYTQFSRDEIRQKIWDHTTKAFSVIDAGNKFTE